jgi:hypothetical protein
MKSLIRVDRVFAQCRVGDSTAVGLSEWAVSLDLDDVWRAAGAIELCTGESMRKSSGPRDGLLDLLARLENELRGWLQRPEEVIAYLLASRAIAVAGLEVAWHWTEMHRRVWAALNANDAPHKAPWGIRVLPLAAASLDEIVHERIGPALKNAFSRIEFDGASASRITGQVKRVAKLLQLSVEALLEDAYDAFQDLEAGNQPTSSYGEAWPHAALCHLEALSSSLPQDLQVREGRWLEQLRGAIVNYRPPPQPHAPPVEKSMLESMHEHFLNNWD